LLVRRERKATESPLLAQRSGTVRGTEELSHSGRFEAVWHRSEACVSWWLRGRRERLRVGVQRSAMGPDSMAWCDGRMAAEMRVPDARMGV